MEDNATVLLNKRLLNFLARGLNWTELSTIQEKAIPLIINEENDSLIIADTASGKTEAALIPIFNDIITNDLQPCSVLYVAPLKALINDMYERMEIWSNKFEFDVTKWHGDVSKSEKDRFIKNPADILLITPESLEVILMNKSQEEKNTIFNNIKYIIIDEIHYFADSDRGIQLNSLLNRVNQYNNYKPKRIGLSATIGNPKMVADWINPNETVNIIKDSEFRDFKYKVISCQTEDIPNYLECFSNKKVLIFAQSRAAVESLNLMMKDVLNHEDIFVHHSSVGKHLREENEENYKNCSRGFMISTSTLELGIDIGDIDVVVHINPPNNMSSFRQRVGRSGRKSKIQKTIIFANGRDIFLSLAEIILFYENKLENIKISNRSKDILFHQILSFIFENGKVKPKEIYDVIKNVYSFNNISKDEFKNLLKEMIKKEYISINSKNELQLGYNFESKFGKRNFLDFYSVFCPSYEYKVKNYHKEVGTLDWSFVITLKRGDQFILGGVLWKVNKIDYKKFSVYVDKTSIKSSIPLWFNPAPPYSYLISRKVFNILLNDFNHEYLEHFNNESRNLINNINNLAKKEGYRKGIIPVIIDEPNVCIMSFAGNKVNLLLYHIFSLFFETYNYKNSFAFSSFSTRNKLSIEDIKEIFDDIEVILNNPSYVNKINDSVSKRFFKNKFIGLLSSEDRSEINMDIIFDKDSLLDLIKNNEIIEIKKDKIKDFFYD